MPLAVVANGGHFSKVPATRFPLFAMLVLDPEDVSCSQCVSNHRLEREVIAEEVHVLHLVDDLQISPAQEFGLKSFEMALKRTPKVTGWWRLAHQVSQRLRVVIPHQYVLLDGFELRTIKKRYDASHISEPQPVQDEDRRVSPCYTLAMRGWRRKVFEPSPGLGTIGTRWQRGRVFML